jgi:hypothetical protein
MSANKNERCCLEAKAEDTLIVFVGEAGDFTS